MTELFAQSIEEPPPLLGLSEPLPVSSLMEFKRQNGISVATILPTLNEGKTVGAILDTWRPLHEEGLLDKMFIVDSGSTDNTRAEVEMRGFPYISAKDIMTQLGLPSNIRGKGVNMWLAQFLTEADILVFADSDMRNPRPDSIINLLAPILPNAGIQLVKSIFTRDTVAPAGDKMAGGRVTKLTALPLTQIFFPELEGIAQPLNGNIAIRREAMSAIPMASRYEADLQILTETALKYGPDSIAQIYCGSFKQDGQDLDGLERMANQYVRTILFLAEKYGRIKLEKPLSPHFIQYIQDQSGRLTRISYQSDQLDLLPAAAEYRKNKFSSIKSPLKSPLE